MISSEVQRTLVKSPPELWAELSDPSALARHLGELGEIRITHIEPETAVEWEAEDASGTVLLKPSGWGTKVTLTVNRELPEPAPDVAEPHSPVAHDPPAQPISTPQAEPEPLPQADPQPGLDTEPEPARAPAAEAAAEPMLGGEPLPSVERKRTPEPAPAPAPEPTVEVEDKEPAPPPEATVGSEPALQPEPAPRPESRRGFFARLFRRSERERPVEASADELAATIRSPEVLPVAAASVKYLSEPPWAVATPESQPEQPPGLEQHSESHEHRSAVAAIESDGPMADVEHVAPVEHVEHVTPAAHVETAAHRQVEPADSEDGAPADIAAELRAAEEATAERVTAVLTGVLDRLGAAHHRPFSRS